MPHVGGKALCPWANTRSDWNALHSIAHVVPRHFDLPFVFRLTLSRVRYVYLRCFIRRTEADTPRASVRSSLPAGALCGAAGLSPRFVRPTANRPVVPPIALIPRWKFWVRQKQMLGRWGILAQADGRDISRFAPLFLGRFLPKHGPTNRCTYGDQFHVCPPIRS